VRRTDVYALVGAVAAAVSLTALLFTQLTPFTGVVGALAVGYITFIVFYALLVSLDESGPTIRDRVMSVVVHSTGFVLLAALLLVVGYVLVRGWSAMRHLNFWTEDMSLAGPLEPLTIGGALHAIVGTLEQVAVCLAIIVPAGLLCAVFLSELPGRFSRFVRTIVEAMTALPSIVAGLFIFLALILILGFEKSGLAAALALAIMGLPIIVRAADVVLRLVPGTLREASLALGASQWRTVWHVVLPTARPGLATAIILGTARVVGETSPVLLTAGFATGMNANPLSGPQVSLPLFTFDSVRSPEPSMIARGFGAGAALMLLVLVLFVLARVIGGRGAGQLSRRQWRRRARRSARDAARFAARETAHAPETQLDTKSPATSGDALP
jgi:phosphate transport system permease protein